MIEFLDVGREVRGRPRRARLAGGRTLVEHPTEHTAAGDAEEDFAAGEVPSTAIQPGFMAGRMMGLSESRR